MTMEIPGLDDIDGSQLTQAYGSAKDTPQHLRRLASTDAKAAKEALAWLYASILHQQSVYDATACAIPFLVQVASNTSAKNRAKIIEFLQDIENDTRTNPATSSCSGDH